MALLAFSLVSVLALYLFQRVQEWLPLSNGLPNVVPKIAFNTAISFVTNTNWQSYAGESTMGHLVQMAGLTVQNFVSAAVGMAIAAALIRALARRTGRTLGNFWVDLTRTTTRILLPIVFVLALVLVSQGAIQNFTHTTTATTVDKTVQVQTTDDPANTVNTPVTEQQIPGGPVASQEAIKELGTNGGGFFNANSAHPFESPTRLDQPPRDLRPAAHRLRLPDHLWRDGRQQAPGPRRARGDGRAVAHRRARWPASSSRTATPLTRRGVDQSIAADQAGGNVRGQGGPVRPGQLGRLRRLDDRYVDRRRRLRRTTASRRSAA